MGCGFGVAGLIFKQFGGGTVVGIEIDTQKINVAKKLSELTGLRVDFQLGNIQNTNLPKETFDIAFVNEVISHVADRNVFLKEVRRILKKDAVLFISDYGRP